MKINTESQLRNNFGHKDTGVILQENHNEKEIENTQVLIDIATNKTGG